MAKVAVVLMMIVVGLALALDILYFTGGSLELHPTDEQQDKVRIVTTTFGVIFAVVEMGLGLLLWRLTRKPAPPAASTPHRH